MDIDAQLKEAHLALREAEAELYNWNEIRKERQAKLGALKEVFTLAQKEMKEQILPKEAGSADNAAGQLHERDSKEQPSGRGEQSKV